MVGIRTGERTGQQSPVALVGRTNVVTQLEVIEPMGWARISSIEDVCATIKGNAWRWAWETVMEMN